MAFLKNLRRSDWYKKWVYKPYTSKSYKSVKEMLGDRESHGILYELWLDIKYPAIRIWEWPGDRIRDVKHFWQRGTHGVADNDCWGLFEHLLNVKLRGLNYIKKYKHGCPIIEGFGEHPDQTEAEFEAMSKEWDRIVDEMIWTFETAKQLCGHETTAPPIEKPYFTDEEVKKWQKFCDEMNVEFPDEKYRVMTKEEFERYKQGWEYYKQYFFSLWD